MPVSKQTVATFQRAKAEGRKLAMLTAYDYSTAKLQDEAGVDGIQLDKLPVDDLAAIVPELRAIDPHLTLIAAGGINLQNAAAYAATGVDGLATTAPFTAKPIDMSVRMKRAE